MSQQSITVRTPCPLGCHGGEYDQDRGSHYCHQQRIADDGPEGHPRLICLMDSFGKVLERKGGGKLQASGGNLFLCLKGVAERCVKGCEKQDQQSHFQKIAEMTAKNVNVPIALHADHFRDYDAIVQAIAAGYTSVMIDASRFPIEENIRLTKEVVKVAHAAGVSVEAELGRLPGNEGDEDVTVEESFQTDPKEAAYFVEQTGIDALAVSIGTMHGAYPASFKPQINIERLKEIAAEVSIPLVMHGGSGTPEDKIAEAVECGIAKINIATDLVTVTAKKMAEVQQASDFRYNVTNTYQEAKKACEELVEARMRLLNKAVLK